MWDLVPDQGWNLGPLHWELGVLATGAPGKSRGFPLACVFLSHLVPSGLQALTKGSWLAN